MAAASWRQQIKDLNKKEVLKPFSLQKIFKTISDLLGPTVPEIAFLDLNAKYQCTLFAGETLRPRWKFYGIVPSETRGKLPLERSRGNVKVVDLQRISSIGHPPIHCMFNYWTRLSPQELIQSFRLAVLTNVELFVIPKAGILKDLIKLCCLTTVVVLNFDRSRTELCFFEIKDKLSETQRVAVLTWCNQFLIDHQERNIALVF